MQRLILLTKICKTTKLSNSDNCNKKIFKISWFNFVIKTFKIKIFTDMYIL